MNWTDWAVVIAGVAAIGWVNWYFFVAGRSASKAGRSARTEEG